MPVFENALLDKLPPKARAKVIALDEERDNRHAAVKIASDAVEAAFERRDLVERNVRAREVQSSPSGSTIRLVGEELENLRAPLVQAETDLERAQGRLDRAAEAWRETDFIGEIRVWVGDVVRAGIRLKDITPSAFKGGDHHKIVEAARRRLDELTVELDRTSNAPRPLAEARTAIIAEIDAIAERGRPDVDLRRRETSPVKIGDSFGLRGQGNTHGTLGHAVIWACRDLLVERALSLLPAQDMPGTLTDADRDAAFDRIASERLKVEREEEAAVVAAASIGLSIARRRNADPRAVLEIDEV